MYIYIYIERERDTYIYIYVYIYICVRPSLGEPPRLKLDDVDGSIGDYNRKSAPLFRLALLVVILSELLEE